MNKKNNLLEKLLVVGLIGLFGYPLAMLSGRLLAEVGSADRPGTS